MTGGTPYYRQAGSSLVMVPQITEHLLSVQAQSVLGDTFYVGYSGTGTLNMTGGTITVTNTFGVAQHADSTGTANLNGGSISCGSFNMTSGGHVDITTGTLIINGDVTAAIKRIYHRRPDYRLMAAQVP